MKSPRSVAALAAVVLAVVAILVLARPAAAQVDVTPSVIVSLTISPTLVDTSQTSQTVTITAHITDDLSGMNRTSIYFGPLLYGSDQDKLIEFQEYDLVSGDSVDGVYTDSLTLPRYSADGRWLANYIFMQDEVGNRSVCYVNEERECPADWTSYFFANIRDNLFLYLPQTMGRRFRFD